MAWWNANYARRLQVTIPASASGYAAGTVVRVPWETHVPISQGRMRRDRKDLRVVHDTGTAIEIDRLIETTARITFKLQAPIAPDTTSGDYWIYYGNATEETEPAANPRNVLASYLDGDDIASFTVTGTVTTVTRPRPGFIKHGQNPVVKRTAGTPWSHNARDMDGLFWHEESQSWLFWFDAADRGEVDGYYGWQSYLMRSRDLIHWESLGAQILGLAAPTDQTVQVGDDTVATSMIVHKFPNDPKYYATYLGSERMGDGVSLPPYRVMGAWSNSPLGPWTKVGALVSPGAAGEGSTGDGHIVTYDNGATYEIYYGYANYPGPSGCSRARSTTGPLGPYTRIGFVLPDAGLENPHLFSDGAQHYLIANDLSSHSSGGYCSSNPLYWSADRGSFDARVQTSAIEPSYGEWDEYWIGLPSVPVFRDGMCYVGYDGATLRGKRTNPTHYGHDVGLAEARWPFPQKSAIQTSGALTESLATGPAMLMGDGVITVRALIVPNAITSNTSAGTVTALAGAQSYGVLGHASSSASALVTVNDRMVLNGVNQTPPSTLTSGYDGYVSNEGSAANNHVRSYTFRRTGSTLKVTVNGVQIWTGPCSTEPMSIRLAGNVLVEEVWAAPASVAAAEIVFTEVEASGSPIDASMALLTGSAEAFNFSRFALPGPLKIWNGTALVDAPLRLFDGSSLS